MRDKTPTGPLRALSPFVYGPHGPDFDLIVVGGGCLGTGIARDAALRGLRVLLLEKDDLGAGATGNGSGLLGEGTPGLGLPLPPSGDGPALQRIGRHLLQRIPFLLPLPSSRRLARSRLALLEAKLAVSPLTRRMGGGTPVLRVGAAEVHRLLPGLALQVAGGLVCELWALRADRWVVANAVAAVEAGAQLLLGHRLEALLQTATGRVFGVRVRQRATGLTSERTAAVVVNAGGAWAGQVAALAGQAPRLEPKKGVHLLVARPLVGHGVVLPAIDGRSIFVMPWQHSTWIGATDCGYFGDPDDLAVAGDDVEYLLRSVGSSLPHLLQAPLAATRVGLQVGPGEGGGGGSGPYAHRVVDHGLSGASGLVSVIGGSLAAHRAIAEETVDLVCGRLRRIDPCRTHKLPLPGAERQIHVPLLAESTGMPEAVVQRLVARQGDRARQVLDESPGELEIVCRCNGVSAAEIRYVVRHEWVRDLAALRRRTELSRGECGGDRCATRAAQLLGLELGLTPRQTRELVRDDERLRFRLRSPLAAQGGGASGLALSRMLGLAGRDVDEG